MYKNKAADDWIKQNGMDVASFNETDVRLLKAQQQAHIMLTHHVGLLTYEDERMLRYFQQQMSNKRTRSNLKPASAHIVLNIAAKIKRQLFKQYRQTTKGKNSGTKEAR